MSNRKFHPFVTFAIIAGLLGLGVIIGMVVAPVRAQSMNDRMGFVDVKKALEEHPKRQSVLDQISAFEEAKRKELPSLGTEPTKAEIDQYVRKRDQILSEIDKERTRLIAPLIDDVEAKTKKLGEETGIDFILERGSVLYGGIDLTPKVINRLNGKLD